LANCEGDFRHPRKLTSLIQKTYIDRGVVEFNNPVDFFNIVKILVAILLSPKCINQYME